MQFFDVRSPSQIRRHLADVPPLQAVEALPVARAARRVLAVEARAPEDLPAFPRAVVDGFAVRAADTFGASPGQPAFLVVVGEVMMGERASTDVRAGGAIRIATGAMAPESADAVVMVEYTETVDAATIEVVRAAAPGDGMVRRGDDARAGAVIVAAGRRLRPQDVGALAAAGITEVTVYRRPRVVIISTGDEVVPPEESPGPGQIRDVNSIALAAAVKEAGGEPLPRPIVPDEPERFRAAVCEALDASDLVLLTGGSSVGARDWALATLTGLPDAELLAHGAAIRPGKPLILVRVGERILFGLPGNPVSALIVFDAFVRDYLARLGGECRPLPAARTLSATLAAACASDPGKEDYLRVRLREADGGWTAEPLLGKSTLIMPMVEADGVVVIPEGVEGVEAGESVDVRVF
jgi:molybdopterin molybdotransferase